MVFFIGFTSEKLYKVIIPINELSELSKICENFKKGLAKVIVPVVRVDVFLCTGYQLDLYRGEMKSHGSSGSALKSRTPILS